VGKRAIALLAAAVVLASIAAGCGGSEDGTTDTSTAPALTKAEFIKQANGICGRTNKQFEDEFERFAEKETTSQSQELSNAQFREAAETLFIPIVGQQLKEVRALGAPQGDEQQVDKILSSAEKALQEARQDPTILFVEGDGPFAEANKLAGAYGLDKCGGEN
jgi:hypothetical protein